MEKLPEEFIKNSLTALPPSERAALLQSLETEPPARALRYRSGFLAEGVPVPWAECAQYIPPGSFPGASPLHEAGAYYLQEPSAMAAVSALDVRPGQRVLDLCAAPGGKSTQIAALLGGEGVLCANEIVRSRAKILSRNIERMGVLNAVVTCAPPETLAEKWGPLFDRVLVDAPCSGEGMFRRDPETRAQWTPEAPAGCAARQLRILRCAAELVAEGGLLVYSTCTFNETENEGVVRGFLHEHAAFQPEEFSLPGVGGSSEGCLRLWPHRLRGEGHFIARLRKSGNLKTASLEAKRCELSGLLPDFPELCAHGVLYAAGDRRWVLPEGMPPLSGIGVLRMGLCVAEHRGKVTLPDHALSHALPPEAFARRVDVGEAEAAAYLRGEALEAGGLSKGYALIAYRGFGLGFAKCADGVLKNHLPKGLRVTPFMRS